MMMLVEPDGVLFAGDIVQNSRIPFMNSDDVDTANWLRGARRRSRSSIRNSSFPATAGRRPRPRQAIAFTRDYIELCARRDGQGGGELDRFRRRLCSRPIGRSTRPCPLSSSNNRGNAYRIFLEMEQSQFKDEKPDSTLR